MPGRHIYAIISETCPICLFSLFRITVTNSAFALKVKELSIMWSSNYRCQHYATWQNFFNLMSNNWEILRIRHLRRMVPRRDVLVFSKRKASSVRQAVQEHVQKGLQECTSPVVVYPDPFSPTPSNSSGVMTPWNAEDDHDGPGPAEEGDIQMEYCCDWLYSPIIGAVTKYCM